VVRTACLVLLGCLSVLGGCFSKADASRTRSALRRWWWRRRSRSGTWLCWSRPRWTCVLLPRPTWFRKRSASWTPCSWTVADRVKKGQLLALVRPSDLPDQLTAARSVLGQQQASLALARSSCSASRPRLRRAWWPPRTWSEPGLQWPTAEAGEAASSAQAGALAVRLGETRIESPLEGVVTHRRLDPGALTGPPNALPILTVARVDVLRVFIAVNDADVARVALGQLAACKCPDCQGEPTKVRWCAWLRGWTQPPARWTPRSTCRTPGSFAQACTAGARSWSTPTAEPWWFRSSPCSSPTSAATCSWSRADQVKRYQVETGVDGGDWLEITRGLSRGQQV